MEKNERIALSVLDVEKKYTYDVDEVITSDDKMVQWGKNNDIPTLYLNCYRNSASLKSIIDGTVGYILGEVIQVNAAKWAETVNRRGISMRQFIAHLAMSLLTYGGFAFQIIYNKLGSPVELYPLDFRRCRTNESKTKVWYSKKGWTRYSTKSECFDSYNPNKFDVNNPTQIFWYGGDYCSSVYPFPPYYGAMADVLTEIECSKYSLNSVANGFAARYIINFPQANNLTDEQKDGIETAIKNKFCGSETDANFMLYWDESGTGNGIDVKKIETDDAPEKFIAIKDNARANIFTSMRATPNLFGLPTASTGFNSQEYDSAMKLYERTVVSPYRDVIIEAISKVVGVENSVEITPIIIDFNTAE